MTIETQEDGGLTIVRLAGSMDGGGKAEWADAISKLLDRPGARKIIVDLSAVDFLGSAALGDLVRLTALANSQGGRIALARLSPFVEGVLKTTRLNKFFDIYDDLAAAKAALQ